MSETNLATTFESFIINDIEVGIYPSDVMCFDDNYVYDQSFLRSNSVYCYRSKYSDTKVVLNFPFDIKGKVLTNPGVNSTETCIRLITELNNYPFCFIKNNRIRSYVAPNIVSSTGFMMFAIEELALVQSAAASNMVFLEVTLRYFNFANVASDFNFVSNKMVTEIKTKATGADAFIEYDHAILHRVQPQVVSSLSSSYVWAEYVTPKQKRVYERLAKTGVLKAFDSKDTKIHPGLDVQLFAPTVYTNGQKGEKMLQEDDGTLVGPDSKVIYTTDTTKMDSDSLPDMLKKVLDQDFRDDEEKKQDELKNTKKDSMDVRLATLEQEERQWGTDYTKHTDKRTIKTSEEIAELHAERDKRLADKNKIPGFTEKVINYGPVSLTNLGIHIQKIEVRKKNLLASHKIGSYKHPFIQYMGKVPARINIEFINKGGDVYHKDLGTLAVLNNIMGVVDRNRLENPDAEVYNHFKIVSLASVLLGVDSILPNQTMTSATADRNGYETVTTTFMQTDTEEFVKQFQVEASGARSMTKAYDELLKIVLQWLNTFKGKMRNGKLSAAGATDTENFRNTMNILRALAITARKASEELGYTGLAEYLAADRGIDNISSYFTSGVSDDETIALQHVTNNPVSGLVLYLQEIGESKTSFLQNLLESAGQSEMAMVGVYTPTTSEIQRQADVKAMLNLTHHRVVISLGNYAFWLSDYIRVLIEARAALRDGKQVTLKNVNFRPTNDFNTLLQNAVTLIASLESSTSNNLSEGQKDFLNNYYDLYVGSLYGQNLEDLRLDDLAEEAYDITKDVLVQNTDPFFFLTYNDILGDEMIDFYNQAYQEADLDPSLPKTAKDDAINEPAIVESDRLLDVSYRHLEEVEYNAEDEALKAYEYGDDNSNEVHVFGTAGTVNVKLPSGQVTEGASKAIENALIKYGMANDNEFRAYMYKTASIESAGGTNLNGNSSSAKGMFQFLIGAISAVMQRNNRVFAREGYVKLSPAQADKAAAKVHGSAGFARDLQLNADLFIEYMSINSGKRYVNGKFSEVATFAYHNQGAGGAGYIEKYLSTGKEPNVPTNIWTNLINNNGRAPHPVRTWVAHYTEVYSKMNPTVTGKAIPTGAPTDAKQGNKPSSVSGNSPVSAPRNVTISAGTILKGKVNGHSDGDTFFFLTPMLSGTGNRQDTIRIAGADTMETQQFVGTVKNSKYDPSLADWGEKAKARLIQLMPKGADVAVKYLDNDAKKNSGNVRFVGEITIHGAKKGEEDPALVLIREGLSVLSSQFSHSQKYQAAMTAAQRAKVGIWSGESVKAWEKRKEVIQTKGKAVEDSILNGARNRKAPRTNVWQPFADGVIRQISSDFTFGTRRTDMGKERKTPHNGIDISCNTGTTVIAAASGIASVRTQRDKKGKVTGGGLYIEIDHKNGFTTRYMHLNKTLVKSGQMVAYKQPIALSGGAQGDPNAGSSTGAHLHYEVRYKGTPIHPYTTKRPLSEYAAGAIYDGPGYTPASSYADNYYEMQFDSRSGVTEHNTVFNEDKLAQAILTNAKDGMNVGLKAAVPSIKAFIVIGNENDGLGLDTLANGPQYYEVKGIQSFQQYCNNDQTPVDTAIMRIIDPSFANTDPFTSLMRIPQIDFTSIGSDYETQFKGSRALLKPGTKLSIRMGYGNNPNDLRVVFNGGITEVTNNENQIMTLLLEGYGRELLAEVKSPAAPEKLAGASHASSSTVLGFGLQSKPIDHLGYMANHLKWLYKREVDPESRNIVKVFDTGHSWFYTSSAAVHRSRLYMNIFAPEIEKADDSFAKYWTGIFESFGFSNRMFGYPFFVYQMTPWDICKQMEYRHPGTIFKPMIYEDHMTPFYGVKEQMYFSRDLSRRTQQKAAEDLADTGYKIHSDTVKNYYDRRRERMEPVSNMHFVSSSSNLISNQMSLNGNWKTCTNISYFNDNDDFNNYYDWDSIRMEVDDNLLPWEIREKETRMSGIHGKYSAFVYGTTDLKKEAETMYQGKLLVLGNPNIKCGDYIMLDDHDNRMSGLMLVRECIHHFNANNGFVTEITPGLYVEPTMFMYTPLWLKLMCAMKIGASKSRLMLSTTYTSEFAYVKQFISILDQLELLDKKPANSDDWMITSQYMAMIGFAGWMTYALNTKISANYKVPSLLVSSWAGLKATFSSTERLIGLERWKTLKNGSVIQAGKADLSKAYAWAKRGIIASETFKAGKDSRTFRTARFVYLRKIAPKLGGTVKAAATTSMKSLLRVGLVGFTALSASNPITLALDVIFTLIVSWGFAKIEETEYTRQPLMFFPILRHGKPYQAGMTGAIRNSYWDSITQNWNRNMNTISKAAALHATNIEAKGGNPGMLLSVLGASAKKAQAEQAGNNWISTTARQGTPPGFGADTNVTYDKAANLAKQGDKVTEAVKKESTATDRFIADQAQKLLSGDLSNMFNTQVVK